MPATTWRFSEPKSTCSLTSLFDFGTRSASTTRPVTRRTLWNSWIEMRPSSSAVGAAAGRAGSFVDMVFASSVEKYAAASTRGKMSVPICRAASQTATPATAR